MYMKHDTKVALILSSVISKNITENNGSQIAFVADINKGKIANATTSDVEFSKRIFSIS